ncbi:hypothetical protein [uncultured Cetobacterium sp.]|uniref:hypothetical protein n=1 Tax=uncultured Cetobacterium sp. TaxID=527638 RepID=UPI002621AB97|nr:hypothetical protein [uncultured Cetobacterium sp.]
MKKTLFILKNCDSCDTVKNLFNNRHDVTIYDLDTTKELAEKLHVTKAPTLVVEDWESVTNYVGIEKIKEYLSDEPTPNYPCVCSE